MLNPKAIDGLTDKRYFGKVCAKHPELSGLRLKSTSHCVACKNVNNKAWHGSNKDRVAQRKKLWYDNNREVASARMKAWHESNKEHEKLYREANKDKVTAGVAKRRAAKIQRTVAWADEVAIARVYAQAKKLGMTVDHVVPLRGKLVSGLHVEYNLQIIPASENFTKRNLFTPYTTINHK